MVKRLRGKAWMQLRQAVLEANPLCVTCKAKGEVTLARFVDHKRALANGGTNDIGNLQGLCKDCHDEKTNRDLGRKQKQRVGSDGWPIQLESR